MSPTRMYPCPIRVDRFHRQWSQEPEVDMQRKEVVGLEGTAMDLWDRLLMMIPDGAMAMAERSSLSQMHRFMR